MENDLTKLLLAFPNENWDFDELAANRNIKLNFIYNTRKDSQIEDEFADMFDTWRELRSHVKKDKQITKKYCNSGIKYSWALESVGANSDITPDFFPMFLTDYSAEYLSRNPNLTMEFYMDNIEFDFDHHKVFENPAMTIHDIIEFSKRKFDDIIDEDELWYYASSKPSVTWEMVLANPDLPWHFKSLPACPSITLDIIRANPQYEWDMEEYSANPNVTIEEVLANPDIDWNYDLLSMNAGIKIEDIIAHPELPWNHRWVSENPNLTYEIIIANPQIQWDFVGLSRNTFGN